MWAILRAAASIAAATSPLGLVTPLILRTNWRAAASISSRVAGGSSPLSSVMFLHMEPKRRAATALRTEPQRAGAPTPLRSATRRAPPARP